MRDHITHVGGIPLVFYAGGVNDGATAFRHPKTLVEVPGHYFEHLANWINEMEALIHRMRA
jgi:hypothetical protein